VGSALIGGSAAPVHRLRQCLEGDEDEAFCVQGSSRYREASVFCKSIEKERQDPNGTGLWTLGTIPEVDLLDVPWYCKG
jgi:hypothetical protein